MGTEGADGGARPDLARLLEPVIEPAGVEVAVGPTPGVDAAVRFLEASMSAEAPQVTYLADGRVSPARAAGACAAALVELRARRGDW